MKKKIGLLIDSSSTIDLNFAKKNNIKIVPISITDSQSKVYQDNNKEIPYETLLKRLSSGENFKTSMTPIGQLMNVVEEMSKEYEEIIFLPVSKGLSGQWQSAHIVKKEFPNLHIIDSRSAAFVNEIIAREVIKNIHDKKSVQEILNSAEKIYDKTFSIFSVEDPTGMKSGGRVTKAIVRVIDILKLQPIIRLNEKNEYAGIAKNYVNGMKKMIKATFAWCKDVNQRIKEVCIYSSNYGKDKLEYIKKVLIDSFNVNKENIHVRNIPPGVLIHTKPGSYGYAVLIN